MLLLAACGRTDERAIESITGNAMGTTYQVKYLREGNSGVPVKAALEEGIVEILSEIDRQMSTYRSDSDLSRFNASRSTDWYPVPAGLLTVLSTAAVISKRSGGAFDVTVKPLVDLWGFGSQRPLSPAVPHSDAVAATRVRVGHEHLSIRREPAAIRKDIPDLEVDLGAIAPGYAVDRIARFLSETGVKSYLVELGGEVFGRGRRPDGRGWQVGIERPTDSRRKVDISLELDGKGLSVSGGYRNYFERNGTRYSHEIDPVTAAPVSHRTVAVAVVADTVMEADAWSTALLVLGSARGHDLATREGIAARFATLGLQGVESRTTPAFESAALLPAQ